MAIKGLTRSARYTPIAHHIGSGIGRRERPGVRRRQAFKAFQALGKAQAAQDTEGFAQIIADQKTGQILGALVIGHEASNLIAEITLAVQNELTLESVMETIHAHPTLAESWHEAAWMAFGAPLHLPPKKKL